MRIWNLMRARLRSLLFRDRVEREIDEELRLHIEREIEWKIHDGASPDDARREAAIEFGALDHLKEQYREARGWQPLDAALVVGQIGLSVTLVIGAGLFVRTFGNLLAIDPGFRTEKILSAQVSLVQLALLGLVLGIVIARLATQLVAGMLFGVTATDPLTYLATGLVTMVIVTLACFIPALRAARIDPVLTLRAE
jgi:hypothetical protein